MQQCLRVGALGAHLQSLNRVAVPSEGELSLPEVRDDAAQAPACEILVLADDLDIGPFLLCDRFQRREVDVDGDVGLSR